MSSPSSKDNFEYSKSRTWDILAASMGLGGVGLSVGLGVHLYGKAHKNDVSKINGGTAAGSSAGGSANRSPVASWKINGTFDPKSSFRHHNPGFAIDRDKYASTVDYKNKEGMFNSPLPEGTSTHAGSISTGIRNTYRDGSMADLTSHNVGDLTSHINFKVGGRSAGNFPDLSKVTPADVYLRKVMGGGTPVIEKAIKLANAASTKSVVLRRGNQMAVMPGLLLPNATKGAGSKYKLHSMLDIIEDTTKAITEGMEYKKGTLNTRLSFNLSEFWKDHDPFEVGKQFTAFINESLQYATYSKDLGIRELSIVKDGSSSVKQHKDVANLFANMGLYGNDLDAKGANRITTDTTNNLTLSNSGKTYYHFTPAIKGGGSGSSGRGQALDLHLLGAEQSQEKTKLGFSTVLLKEEKAVKGYLSTASNDLIANMFMHPESTNITEFMHNRLISGKAAPSAKLLSYVKQARINVDQVYDTVYNLSNRKLNSAHRSKELGSKNVLGATSFNIPFRFVSGGNAGASVFEEGTVRIGTMDMLKGGSTVNPYSIDRVNSKTIVIGEKGGVLSYRIGSVGADGNLEMVSIAAKMRKQMIENGMNADKVRALTDVQVIEKMHRGDSKGQLNVRGGDVIEITSKNVNGEETVVRERFQNSRNITSIAPNDLHNGIVINSIEQETITDIGSRQTLGFKAHVSVAGVQTAEQFDSGMANMLNISKNHGEFAPQGIAHVGSLKPIDTMHIGVNHYLVTTAEMAKDAYPEDIARQNKAVRDSATDLFKILKRNSLASADFMVHAAPLTEGKAQVIDTIVGLGTDDATIERAMRQEGNPVQKALLEMRHSLANTVKGLSERADKALTIGQAEEMFPILVGSAEHDAHLMTVGSDGMTTTKGVIYAPLQTKLSQVNVDTGMGADHVKGGKSAKKGSMILRATHLAELPHTAAYFRDIMKKHSAMQEWLGPLTSSNFTSPGVIKEGGGLAPYLNSTYAGVNVKPHDDLMDIVKGNLPAMHDIHTKQTIPADLDIEGLDKMLSSSDGYVYDVKAGLTPDIADQINVKPVGASTKSASEVLMLPYHIMMENGKQGSEVRASEHTKSQVGAILKFESTKSRLLSNIITPQQASDEFHKTTQELYDARDRMLAGKTGAALDYSRGVRTGLGGYQHIQDSTSIFDALRKADKPNGAVGEFNIGLYTKDAKGKLVPVDGRLTLVSSLDSINSSEAIAYNTIKKKVGKGREIFTRTKEGVRQVGISPSALLQAHPTHTATSIQAVDIIYMFNSSLSENAKEAMEITGKTAGMEDTVGKLTKGVLFYDSKLRQWMYRDLDGDHVSIHVPGGTVTKKGKANVADIEVQPELRSRIDKVRNSRQYEFDSRFAGMQEQAGASDYIKLGVKEAGDLNRHGYREGEDILGTLSARFSAQTQKLETPLLDTALTTRVGVMQEVIQNPAALHSVIQGLDEADRGVIQTFLPTSKGIDTVIEGLIGTQKQTTIAKGYGAFLTAAGLGELGNSFETSAAGKKLQNLYNQGQVFNYLATTEDSRKELLDGVAHQMNSVMSEYVDEIATSPDAADFKNQFGSKLKELLPQIKQKLTEEGSVAKTVKLITKAGAPLGGMATPELVANDLSSEQIKPVARAIANLMEGITENASEIIGKTPSNQTSGGLVNAIKNTKGVAQEALASMTMLPKETQNFNTQEFLAGSNLANVESPEVNPSHNMGSTGDSATKRHIKERIKRELEEKKAGKKSSTIKTKPGFLSEMYSAAEYMVKEGDKEAYQYGKGAGKMVDLTVDFVKNNKKWFAGAAAGGVVIAASHVAGAINSPSTSIVDAPLPPNTPLDDGAMLPGPQYSSFNKPKVRVAGEMESMNATDINFSGANASSAIVQDVDNYFTNTTYIHDGRSSFNRNSMNTYKQEQSAGRF